ncbi:carbon storage regulator CsrA [Aneurinibacillus tyrosinisolvens]|uniref:carbon storage regulator CsrA n=1 Tax=Aneurinibacillus tyrosinisolvens TaxID=1443435 RepID=UPI00063F6178|nr:carbon storage regulator CsrA [Aneurinibacillus tyrosinisolvens]
MLVLTRKKGESIVIGDNITVKIISTEGDQVKIAIDAPRHVEIHRQEVYEAIQAENRLAGTKQAGIDIAQLKQVGSKTSGMKIGKKE